MKRPRHTLLEEGVPKLGLVGWFLALGIVAAWLVAQWVEGLK